VRRTILAALAISVAAVVAFVLLRHGPTPARARLARLSAPEATDVSKARAPQSEVAVALEPGRETVAVAGSNDLGSLRMRVYASVDGGSRWRSSLLPLPAASLCATSDPAVAIDRTGRQLYAFLGVYCRGGRTVDARVFVTSRAGPRARWRVPLLAVRQKARTLLDDRPSITVDDGVESPHRGRLYLGWTRFSVAGPAVFEDPDATAVDFLEVSALVSHSDDGGRHWSKPVVLSHQGDPFEVRLATARDGTAYVSWRDARSDAVFVSSSPDGRVFRSAKLVAPAVVRAERSCHTFRARIPAQPKRCVSPNPTIAVDASTGPRSGRVYVVWGSTSLNGSQDVYVAAFDPDLRPVLGVGHLKQVNPPEGFPGPDQFLPTAALDQRTGDLWACYYQTVGSPLRRSRFTCTTSEDGGKSWLPPLAATTVLSDETHRPANVANGYGDYEGVAAADGRALAVWTDGRRLKRLGEEIYAARLGIRRG
jgi:hypothetical protein